MCKLMVARWERVRQCIYGFVESPLLAQCVTAAGLSTTGVYISLWLAWSSEIGLEPSFPYRFRKNEHKFV